MENNIQSVIFARGEATAKNEYKSIIDLKCQLLTKKIESAIKDKQYNRQQFAHLMGVSPSIITRWLSGNHNFTVETLFQIEEQLGIQLFDIERPTYKQMNYNMVVGSAPIQHFHSPFIEELSYFMSSHITYCVDGNESHLEENSKEKTEM
ncbi:MAG: helix-turn-helix transcriptional regulator [Bacteroidota bacterium]